MTSCTKSKVHDPFLPLREGERSLYGDRPLNLPDWFDSVESAKRYVGRGLPQTKRQRRCRTVKRSASAGRTVKAETKIGATAQAKRLDPTPDVLSGRQLPTFVVGGQVRIMRSGSVWFDQDWKRVPATEVDLLVSLTREL